MTRQVPAHFVAGGLALLLASFVSTTVYTTTAVQFVSPLAVILMVHVGWLAATGALKPGFARIAFGRMVATTVCIAFATMLLAVFAPMPAAADSTFGSFFQDAGVVLVCLAMVAVVLMVGAGIVAIVVFIVLKLLKAIGRWRNAASDRDDTRANDFGSIAIALLVIGFASQEGVTDALTFAAADRTSSTVVTTAAPDRVWQAIGKATSPDFPLPALLRAVPRPVAVLVDEGTALGARRIVHFVGREGEGDLVLRVTHRTLDNAVFQVESDRSPIAAWVTQKALTFKVEPAGTGTRLTVSLDYDRRLSPAWFFGPYMRLATFLAADVLARDTADRAAALAS